MAGSLAVAAGMDLASDAAPGSKWEWIHSVRTLIAEGYNPPFYPSLDYQASRAVKIAQRLHCDSMRYPGASYYAFFPTESGYPIHPELKGDPMRETLTLLQEAGLRSIVYLPFNHAFMDVTSKDPRYAGWSKRFADGKPMVTNHYGYGEYYEGCLNSPLREVILSLVRDVVTHYPFEVIYFDGPYQGMRNGHRYCHCEYCEAAYRKKSGKPVPDQNRQIPLEDIIQYEEWMTNDVAIALFREIRNIIRQTRDVPVLFNDTALLSPREWRSRAVPVADGFMFEAASTPEEKLFNLQLGQSTGKVIWTYLGHHTEYDRAHLKDDSVRGWYSYPIEGQELLLDGATAVAAGAGMNYWGLQRFFYSPDDPLEAESGRYLKEIFDFKAQHATLLSSLKPRPQVGILVSDQTINWYSGAHFVPRSFGNYFRGAYNLLKTLSIESEPFLDWYLTPELLAKYPVIFAPNAVCLSDAQCQMIRAYVQKGGILIATHLTSVADEYGRVRKDFGLADLFGASFLNPEPIESPDLYLKLPGGEIIPQDPQILLLRRNTGDVLAETLDRGRRRNLGPAVLKQKVGSGQVVYIGSGLEAVYEETRLHPLRAFWETLLSGFLYSARSYELTYQPGVMAHYMSSADTIVLHLLADTGDKIKLSKAREHFLPVTNIQVRIQTPRPVRSVTCMRSGTKPKIRQGKAWIDVTLEQLLIHEAIRVDLA